jgi:hypothetical protein
MKFETINNQLCRMVEPEPLTPEANFPCVVRLIQDDSPMGRNNDFYATSHLLARIEIINGLDAIHFVRWQGSKTYYSRFEIIGYPVADGSLEWALYQIRTGKKVVKEGGGEQYGCSFYKNRLFYLNGSGCLVTKNAIGLIDSCSENGFLDLDKTGWQICKKPKPEPKPEHPAINGYNRYDYIPVEGIRQPKPEPEPPREPEYVICKRCAGTQSVPNPVVSNTAYTTCPKCGGTGYEIEPEPAFKAGDWVTDGVVVGHVAVINDGKAWVKTQDAHYHLSVERLSKVDPSEVVIHIGCLKGTVAPGCIDATIMIVPIGYNGFGDVAIIPVAMLDAPTRSLVESILRAQEEEK